MDNLKTDFSEGKGIEHAQDIRILQRVCEDGNLLR